MLFTTRRVYTQMSYAELGKGPAPPAAAVVLQAHPAAVPSQAVALEGVQPGYGQAVPAQAVAVAQPGYGLPPAGAVPVAVAQMGYGLPSAGAVPVGGMCASGGIAALAPFGDLYIRQRVELVRVCRCLLATAASGLNIAASY